MMMKKLARHGNSRALVIEKPILDLLGIDDNTTLQLHTDGGEPDSNPGHHRGTQCDHPRDRSQIRREVPACDAGAGGEGRRMKPRSVRSMPCCSTAIFAPFVFFCGYITFVFR